MKKLIIILLASMILFSGCVGQDAVKVGDNVSVDYTGSLVDGTVFDTSIASVANESNIFTAGRQYKPLQFTVGSGKVVKGFDEGVVGMKVGDTKKITIPPELGYGPVSPNLIRAYPREEVLPTEQPRTIEVTKNVFEGRFGSNHTIGDIISLQGTNITMTVQELSTNVTLSYNFKVGETLPSQGIWNETVIAINKTNFTVDYGVKKNDIIQFPSAKWNTTVLDVTADNITIKHNAIPDTEIQTIYGPVKVSFNDTSIIIDRNPKLAGKTLVFNVTLKSINK